MLYSPDKDKSDRDSLAEYETALWAALDSERYTNTYEDDEEDEENEGA